MDFSCFTASLIFILLTGIFGESPDSCCDHGYEKAALAILEDISCDPDNTIANKFTDTVNSMMCRSFYKGCCQSSAEIQYCLMGKRMAIANQLCLKSSNFGGDFQLTCCECCKQGTSRAKAGGVCEADSSTNEKCQESFVSCCKETQAAIPTKKPHKSKTCQDIICNSVTTRVCIEGSEGPQCLCKDGFAAQNDGITCVDINECLSGENNCPESCVNTLGSYSCPCALGMTMVDGKCVEAKECDTGYVLFDGKCLDINECTTGQHRCPALSYCLNTPGSYRCTNCNSPNYKIIGKGLCGDVDECEAGTHVCNEYFKCVNQIGTYKCKRIKCYTGYKLVGDYCEDINECLKDPNICGEYGKCRNQKGTHFCDCQTGFKVNQLTGKCEDEDECQLGLYKRCAHECVNTLGSYRCNCPEGFEVRGEYCYDIDECAADKNLCKSNEFCFNTYGGYRCIDDSCPANYTPSYVHRGSPAGCLKKYCNGDMACENIALQSIKRVAYLYWSNVKRNRFSFTYTTGFNKDYYDVEFKLERGNKGKVFSIHYVDQERKKIEILNDKEIIGPKDFHFVLETTVSLRRTGAVIWRYEYHFFVFVSQYNFV